MRIRSARLALGASTATVDGNAAANRTSIRSSIAALARRGSREPGGLLAKRCEADALRRERRVYVDAARYPRGASLSDDDWYVACNPRARLALALSRRSLVDERRPVVNPPC